MGLAKAAPAWLCLSEKAIFQKFGIKNMSYSVGY